MFRFISAKTSYLFMLALMLSVPGHTQNIEIPIGQQAADKQQLERPQKGMTRDQVLAAFGEPDHKREAKGDPPISRWEYSAFVVYFEYNHVVHTVLKHIPVQDSAPTEDNSTDAVAEDAEPMEASDDNETSDENEGSNQDELSDSDNPSDPYASDE